MKESTTTSSFERVLDARLVLSVIAAGIMSFSGVTVETAMNVTFPALMAEFSITTSTAVLSVKISFAFFSPSTNPA